MPSPYRDPGHNPLDNTLAPEEQWRRQTRRATWTKALVTLSIVGGAIGLTWQVGVEGLLSIPIAAFILLLGIGGCDPPQRTTSWARHCNRQ